MTGIVANFFSQSAPLGPSVADPSWDAEHLRILFDDNNKLTSELNHEKSLIIGRKGSGKTTLLTSVVLSEPAAKVFYLPTDDVFSTIIREVNRLSEGVTFVEQIGRIWTFALWTIAIDYTAKKYKNAELTSFCDALGLRDSQGPYDVLSKILKAVNDFPPQDGPIPEKIAYKLVGSLSFLQAKQITVNILLENKERVFLLMDSLEEVRLDVPAYGAALAGLLRCLGEFNDRRSNAVIVRCCLPAERYFDYLDLSANPLKDFRSGLVVHWSARELLQLCAIRYCKFLKEYYEDIFFRNRLSNLDFGESDDLKWFWDSVFPGTVKNRFGTLEKPIAYVLRHTQLLPRHLIVYLNAIISKSLAEDKAPWAINSLHVREAIWSTEFLVKEQILEAYGTPFLNPGTLCELSLKQLSSTFTWSDFDTMASKVTSLGLAGAGNRNELLRSLTEFGAIGRLVDETETYFTGVFEYMVPHKLIFSERDKFCVHPVFAKVYNVNMVYPGAKPVYTYWSGMVDSTMIDWL
jgi:hypothetical protein